MKTQKNPSRIFLGTLILVAVWAACWLLMSRVFIEKNFAITDTQYQAAGPIALIPPVAGVVLYVIWLLMIGHSVEIGRPVYHHGVLLLGTFLVTLIAYVVVAVTISSWDTTGVSSMAISFAVCSAIETIGMAIVSIAFRPR